MIKNIFYDLDGTLLPMDMDDFMNAYFKGLCTKAAPLGYVPDKLIDAVWKGTKAMVLNDGSVTNEEAFWKDFEKNEMYHKGDEAVFQAFYENEFNNVSKVVVPDDRIPRLIAAVKEMGFKQTLATNPIFPEIATRSRIKWAGLDENDFETFTAYENSHYCKPNPNYYLEVCKMVGANPEETLMVGNDVDEDMIAEKTGMKVFLITKYMLNKHNLDYSKYPQGDWDDLLEYIKHIND